jgi:hypothetical protein
MYFPTHLSTPVTDPIERERILSGRPASRWEIARRGHLESRLNGTGLAPVDEAATSVDSGARPQVAQSTVSNIRRTVSRVLITTGERIDPEAA